MKSQILKLWNEEEYDYKLAYNFMPNLVSYIHDENEEIRPCIIVVPGGGYGMISPNEARIVAMKYYNNGYNAFVCNYTVNPTTSQPLRMQPLRDLSRAVRFVRKEEKQFHININEVVICGFSAGGHLCGSLCVHYADVPDENSAYVGISNRPNAAILSYPVITSGELAHRGSFDNLLGVDANAEQLHYMSLEYHVTADTPPCFIWHTAVDDCVPVENSYLFAMACQKQNVPYALHVFSKGGHGLSLADEVFEEGKMNAWYTLEQVHQVIEHIKAGDLSASDEAKQWLFDEFDITEEEYEARWMGKAMPEVAVWSDLAGNWLKQVCGFTR